VEDWEIWLRLAQHWAVAYTNTASALYRIHQQSVTASGATNNRLATDDAMTRCIVARPRSAAARRK
jgi:hypothetical protein